MLKSIPFFKKTPDIKESAYRDLSYKLKFQSNNVMDKVIEYGDVGDKFYILFLGVVAINIPNPEIKNWDLKRRTYLDLEKWKKTVFDRKVEQAIR